MDDQTPQNASGADFSALAARQPTDPQDAAPRRPFTEGQLQALREIGSLPAHEQQLLRGMAEWLNGASLRKAAEVSGCSHQTLWQRMRKAGITEADREEVAAAWQPLAHAIYEEAGRQTLELLRDGKDAAPKITWGIAADKVFKILQVEKNHPTTGGGMLERLTQKLEELGGGSLQLTVKHNPPPPDVHAIDITPKASEPATPAASEEQREQ